jgi:hypothetical protein
MQTKDLLKAIDEEIVKLEQARALLMSSTDSEPAAKRRGRPKGSVNRAAKTTKRTMSAEGKARIAAAQKKRWAAQKRAATK